MERLTIKKGRMRMEKEAINEFIKIVSRVKSYYPTKIFTEPKEGSPPDCYVASGCRLACDNIIRELEENICDRFPRLS